MNDICEEGSYRYAFEILMRAIFKNDIKVQCGSDPFFAVNAVNMVRQACTNADIGNYMSFGQWINVNDREPAHKGLYITCDELGIVDLTQYDHGECGWLTDADSNVTHWMPLPEAPKE